MAPRGADQALPPTGKEMRHALASTLRPRESAQPPHRWPLEVDPQSASREVLKEAPSSLCVRSAPPPHSRSSLHQHPR